MFSYLKNKLQHRTVAAALLLPALAGCFYLAAGRGPSLSPEEAKAVRSAFNHEKHQQVLAKEGLHCTDCHAIYKGQHDASAEVPQLLGTVQKEHCHTCHQGSPVQGAPTACATCHKDLKPIIPAYHRGNALNRHAFFARSEQGACATCHNDRFCLNCHQQRDKAKLTVHERNFRFYHSVEARVSARRCDSCHAPKFCITCHQTEVQFK